MCTPANLTRILNLLERDGMIRRTPDKQDRRKTTIQITRTWKAAVASVEKKMHKKAKELESLGEDIDFEIVTSELLKIQSLLRNHNDD